MAPLLRIIPQRLRRPLQDANLVIPEGSVIAVAFLHGLVSLHRQRPFPGLMMRHHVSNGLTQLLVFLPEVAQDASLIIHVTSRPVPGNNLLSRCYFFFAIVFVNALSADSGQTNRHTLDDPKGGSSRPCGTHKPSGVRQ